MCFKQRRIGEKEKKHIKLKTSQAPSPNIELIRCNEQIHGMNELLMFFYDRCFSIFHRLLLHPFLLFISFKWLFTYLDCICIHFFTSTHPWGALKQNRTICIAIESKKHQEIENSLNEKLKKKLQSLSKLSMYAMAKFQSVQGINIYALQCTNFMHSTLCQFQSIKEKKSFLITCLWNQSAKAFQHKQHFALHMQKFKTFHLFRCTSKQFSFDLILSTGNMQSKIL